MALKSLNKLMQGGEMDKKELLKMGAGLVVGFAADIAVGALFHAHIPPQRGFVKLLTKLGIFVLAMKAGEEAEEYFYKVMDDTKAAMNEAKEEAKKEVDRIVMEPKDIGGH